ncbi:MAG TPA: alpha/beta fold hydrolase [Chloroflexia bacterium]|nr:alpha/beta fold hydrolase [Chloroflexia bacterium]
MNRTSNEPKEGIPNEGLPRNPVIRFHFRFPIFDFFFQWLLGAQTHGGSETGEAFYVASKIRNADAESWIQEWQALARRVEARAETSFKQAHYVSAREAYLRAYTYNRAPLAFMSPYRDSLRYQSCYRKAQACFRQAVALLNPPGEIIEIPFEGRNLPGYFFTPDASPTRRKTLIMIGGADTFVEDLYAYIGPAALKRSYNLLIVDLPGQGNLPFAGLVWRTDAEAPMKAVVDYALSRPEVDPERLAAYGISAGGYLVPRAASYEKRLKACVVCSAILDFSGIWPSRTRNIENSRLYKFIMALPLRSVKTRLALFDTYEWRWGAHSMRELYELCTKMTVDPRLITCPFLNLIAEQEYTRFGMSREWAGKCMAEVANPEKKVIVTPANEGADSHSAGTNLSLVSELVFDWLDELFRTGPDRLIATVGGEESDYFTVDMHTGQSPRQN